VEVGVAPVAHGVRVTVADTGPGIPPEELPRVKERFFRGRAAREGTGLGLALAEELVKSHGGTLEIASDGRSGTQAAFFLPGKR
jgi:signal transduction histidine kinase